MPQRARSFCWAADGGGDEATATEIARQLMPCAAWLAGRGTGIYSMTDMKGAPDMVMLQTAAPRLMPLIELDKRGAIFSQVTVARALDIVLEAHGLKPTFHMFSSQAEGECPLSDDEQVKLAAYKIRCMLHHIRAKFDAEAKVPWLEDCFAMMKEAAKSGGHGKDAARRAERLGSRPHPFPFFRDPEPESVADSLAEEQAEQAEQVEHVSPICYSFDYASLTGSCLLSDGPMLNLSQHV